MAKLYFYPTDLSYKIMNGKAHIYMYGRTKEGKQICLIDKNFTPYFFVMPKKNADLNTLKEELKNLRDEGKDNFRVEKLETVKKQYKGEEKTVIKVTTNIPGAVPKLSYLARDVKGVEKCFEYDILFVRRYLIDKGIVPLILTEVDCEPITEKTRVPTFEIEKLEQTTSDALGELKVLSFDIEVYNPEGKITDPERHPIVMIAMYGRSGTKEFQHVLTWKDYAAEALEVVSNEGEMLDRFKELVVEYSPDIITGYYSDGYDFPYIVKRAKKLGVKIDLGLDYSTPDLARGNVSAVDTKGIAHVDILSFIRRVLSRKLKTDSLTLDNVSSELLGDQKDDVDLNLLAQAWDKTDKKLLSKFAKYNLKDARLTFELTEKVLPNLLELVKIVGQPIAAVNRMSFSQLVEWYIMRKTPDSNQLIPNRPSRKVLASRMGVQIKGAFVYEPKPGIYEDVVVFDFRSLYPSIIISHNISPDTLNCECCEEKEKVPIEDHTLWFCSKKQGFMSALLEDIITRRQRVKEILRKADKDKRVFLDARQESLKVLANSYYGYLGFYGARWYCKDCARSTTAYGRYYIKKVIAESEEAGFKILYSDTDSIFILLDGKKKEDALKFVDDINAKLPGVMELEYEGTFPRALFVATKGDDGGGAKKKYAMLDEEGEMNIKGFELVRRNVSPIAKEVQREVLRIILKDNEPELAFEYVKNVIGKLRNHEMDISDLKISTMLTKPVDQYESIGPHVAAAKRMIKAGKTVKPGMIIEYVVCEGKDKIRDRVKLLDEVNKGEYDAEYYIDNQVVPAVERIFDVFGFDLEEVLDVTGQTGLDKFF